METYCLIFDRLPAERSMRLPIDLGHGVRLADPTEVYEQLETSNREKAAVAPHHFSNRPKTPFCLMRDLSKKISFTKGRDDIYFAWLCMRLACPIAASTSGCLIFDDGEVKFAQRDSHRAMFQHDGFSGSYNLEILERAKEIHERLRKLKGRSLDRVRSAIVLFSHVEQGSVLSWQMACLALFGVLDCLFPQPKMKFSSKLSIPNEKYGERLGRRVAAFLQGTSEEKGLKKWLAKCYGETRNNVAHGFHPVGSRSRGTKPRNLELIARLHRVCRLIVLGILGLDNPTLEALLPAEADGIAVQDSLDAFKTMPEFAHRQRFW